MDPILKDLILKNLISYFHNGIFHLIGIEKKTLGVTETVKLYIFFLDVSVKTFYFRYLSGFA